MWIPIAMAVASALAKNNTGNRDPYDAASEYYNKIPGMLEDKLGGFLKSGQDMIPKLEGQYDQLTSDPGNFVNNIGSEYKQSPGYQFQVNQAVDAQNRVGAAGGMAGSAADQVRIADTANNFANQDYYKYISNAMDLYKTGLQGEQGMYTTGANSASVLAQALAAAYMNQGNIAAGQSSFSNARDQGVLNNSMGPINMISSLFGGGGFSGASAGSGLLNNNSFQ